MFKKLLSMALCAIMVMGMGTTAFAMNSQEQLQNNASYPQTMTDQEIDAFIESAVPVPVPSQSRTSPSNERTGSYMYDIQTEQTTFETFSVASSRSNEQSSPGYFPNGAVNIDNSRGVVGSDNRVKIQDTTVGPWCNTVKLLIVGRNNSNYIGSGFMIGPNSVATSGHCVYNTDFGGWAKSITVIPALNGSSKPYGSATSYNIECGGNWYNNNDNQDDWGVIRINADLGNSTGWLGLRWQSASYNGQSVKAVGYPGEDGSCMYYGGGNVTSSSARTLAGDWDISGGQSGGPVHSYYSETGYTALGINRGGSSTYSDCLRIDEWVYNKLISYRTLTY